MSLTFRPRRREFPNPVKRAAYARSNGNCECHRLSGIPGLVKGGCKRPLGIGNTFYEHVNPDANGGAPTLQNCAVLSKTCWAAKTRAYDRPLVAKTNRLGDMQAGIRTGASGIKLPCGRDDWRKKTMLRGVVDRETGARL